MMPGFIFVTPPHVLCVVLSLSANRQMVSGGVVGST